jgi:hypothetical protein
MMRDRHPDGDLANSFRHREQEPGAGATPVRRADARPEHAHLSAAGQRRRGQLTEDPA